MNTILKHLIILTISLSSTISFGQSQWKTLKKNNYEINYPNEWKLIDNNYMETAFIILSKLDDTNDKFKENVNLMIQDLSGLNISLENLVQISEKQINTMLTDAKIIESKKNRKKQNYIS